LLPLQALVQKPDNQHAIANVKIRMCVAFFMNND
jgi:hypothetical protein